MVRVSQFFNNLFDFLFSVVRSGRGLAPTVNPTLTLQGFKDDVDPPIDMIILLLMALNDSIGFPNGLSLKLNQLVSDSLNYPNPHFIILSFVIMVNHNEILMNS